MVFDGLPHRSFRLGSTPLRRSLKRNLTGPCAPLRKAAHRSSVTHGRMSTWRQTVAGRLKMVSTGPPLFARLASLRTLDASRPRAFRR